MLNLQIPIGCMNLLWYLLKTIVVLPEKKTSIDIYIYDLNKLIDDVGTHCPYPLMDL